MTAKKDAGCLELRDKGLLPHVSRVTLREADGKAWPDEPALKCLAGAGAGKIDAFVGCEACGLDVCGACVYAHPAGVEAQK